MNEETPKSQPEKTGIDDKRKNALLRYVAIMFAVAFLLVLLSLIGQMRDSQNTISKLNQSSSSAAQKAEHLQDTNRILEENNLLLKKYAEDLEEEVAELNDQLSQEQALQTEQETAVKDAEQNAENVAAAYELLLTLKTDHSKETLQKMKELKEHLGPIGQKTLETILTEEGE